jgi:hypothetical protein
MNTANTASDIQRAIDASRADVRREIQKALDTLIAYEVGHEPAEALAGAVLDAHNAAQSLMGLEDKAATAANESLRRIDLESREEVDAVETAPAAAGAPTGRLLVYLAVGWWLGSRTSFYADTREQAADILDRCHYIEQ